MIIKKSYSLIDEWSESGAHESQRLTEEWDNKEKFWAVDGHRF